MKRNRFPRPCTLCGTLTIYGSRCIEHTVTHSQLYNYRYTQEAKAIKATATVCALCQEPFTDRNEITADHIRAGDPTSPLQPAHKSCNSRRGNQPI